MQASLWILLSIVILHGLYRNFGGRLFKSSLHSGRDVALAARQKSEAIIARADATPARRAPHLRLVK